MMIVAPIETLSIYFGIMQFDAVGAIPVLLLSAIVFTLILGRKS